MSDDLKSLNEAQLIAKFANLYKAVNGKVLLLVAKEENVKKGIIINLKNDEQKDGVIKGTVLLLSKYSCKRKSDGSAEEMMADCDIKVGDVVFAYKWSCTMMELHGVKCAVANSTDIMLKEIK